MLWMNTTVAHSQSARPREAAREVPAGRLRRAAIARAAVLMEPRRLVVRDVELMRTKPEGFVKAVVGHE